MRETIHEERKKRSSKTSFTCPSGISDSDQVLYGETYSEALKNPKFKTLLLDYITIRFTIHAKELNSSKSIIIDSPTFDQIPILIHGGQSVPMPDRKNNHGEADSGVWFHAKCSGAEKVL